MIKIKFNDDDTLYAVNFRKYSDHVIYIIGNCPSNTSGFLAYKEDGKTLLGDYSKYRTIYRRVSDGVQFSNDGSTWEEPTKLLDFYVIWDDADHPEYERPLEVTINIENDQTHAQTQQLMTAANGWKYEMSNIPNSDNYHISSGQQIEGFEGEILNATTIVYHNATPTWSDRIESQVFYTAMETDTLLED